MINPHQSEALKKDTRSLKERTSKVKSKMTDFARSTYGHLYGDKSVWLVEDDEKWAYVVQRRLETVGVKVVHKKDPSHTLKFIKVFRPRLIILDKQGIPDFDAIIDDFGEQVIVCTGKPEKVDMYVKGSVLAVFGKDNLPKMVEYIEKYFEGQNGSIN